jgi:hypothetical protein
MGAREEGKVEVAPSGTVAENTAAVATLTVMQDVSVDGAAQTRTDSTSGGATDDAVDNHTGWHPRPRRILG